jgi:hypothetical protein
MEQITTNRLDPPRALSDCSASLPDRDRFSRLETGVDERTVRRFFLTLAAAMAVASCDPTSPGSWEGASDFVSLPSAEDAGACLAASEAWQGTAPHPALVMYCTESVTDTPPYPALRADALAALVQAAHDSETQEFQTTVALAENIVVGAASMPKGALVPASRFRHRRLDNNGVIPGRGVPMILIHPDPRPNYPPQGFFEAVAIAGTARRSDDRLTIDLRAVGGGELIRGGWADATGQAYLRFSDQVPPA